MLPVCGGSALDIDYCIVKTGYTLILQLDIDLFLCNMTIKKDCREWMWKRRGAEITGKGVAGVLTEWTQCPNEWFKLISKKKAFSEHNGFRFSAKNKKREILTIPLNPLNIITDNIQYF